MLRFRVAHSRPIHVLATYPCSRCDVFLAFLRLPPSPPNSSPSLFVPLRMTKFLLWLLLLVVCWPLALLALLLYPIVWLLLLPFRILGIAVDGVLELVRAVVLLPARLLGARA